MNHIPTTQKGYIRRNAYAALLLGCAVLLGLTTVGSAATEPPTDSQITGAVQATLLLEEGVSPHLIDVETRDGIVSLEGSVSSLLEHDRALAVTGTVRGVRSIVDRLAVRPVARSDAEIRADVRRALLQDPATDSYEIDVQVEDGVVTLTGTVESWAEKLLVTEVAKGVKGIKEVNDGVDYSYDWERSDQDIQADVEARLKMDPYVDEAFIEVAVEEGVVMLHGAVGSLAEKSYAIDKAHVAGVGRVRSDDLQIKSWAQGRMERTTKVTPVTDAEVRTAVTQALRYDPRVAAYGIDVQVDDGVVTLVGTVDNLEARRAADRDAGNTTGVWKVDNRIKVRPTDELDDRQIATNVRNALIRNPFVERFEIAVQVRNRRVHLTGVVDSRLEKMEAEAIAARVNGVASVDNNIILEKEYTYKSDADIKDGIESEYFWSPFVDGGDLAIRVDDGHAELVGEVDTWHEYREAVENAFEGGATSVRSYMRVAENGKLYDRSWSEPPIEDWPL